MTQHVFFPHAQVDMQQAMGLTLENWIATIKNKRRRERLGSLLELLRPVLERAPASGKLHQTWKGGLRDHLAQMLRWARMVYEHGDVELGRPWPFSWDSVVVAIFCHDAEKYVKYRFATGEERERYRQETYGDKDWDDVKWEVIGTFQNLSNLTLTAQERNAVKYTHGEGADYSKNRRVSNRLAALVGAVDRLSARAFFDVGQRNS
jgi:hypothetical protein